MTEKEGAGAPENAPCGVWTTDNTSSDAIKISGNLNSKRKRITAFVSLYIDHLFEYHTDKNARWDPTMVDDMLTHGIDHFNIRYGDSYPIKNTRRYSDSKTAFTHTMEGGFSPSRRMLHCHSLDKGVYSRIKTISDKFGLTTSDVIELCLTLHFVATNKDDTRPVFEEIRRTIAQFDAMTIRIPPGAGA